MSTKTNHEKPKDEKEPEVKHKMSKKEAQEIVDHYLKVSYTGLPKDLAEAQAVLKD